MALYTTKSYLRKQIKIGKIKTDDLNKFAALASFLKKMEEKLHFQPHFGFPAPIEVKLYVMIKVIII